MANDPFLDASGAPKAGGRSGSRLRIAKWVAGIIVIVLLAYYPIGMLMVHKIDDDPDFKAPAVANGASQSVAVAAALIHREVDVNGWVSNDPVFMPGAALDNMPNFQQGILQALRRFALELQDQIGRSRASSSIDPDLQKAVGQLNYSPTVWLWNLSVSLAPASSSESQYRAAMRALESYNDRLTHGQAVFEPRADNLMTTLDGPAVLFRNEGANANHWLRVQVTGSSSNRSGIGAVVKLTSASGTQTQVVRSGSSYASQSELTLTFGLAADTKATRVDLTWLSGKTKTLTDVTANQTLHVSE